MVPVFVSTEQGADLHSSSLRSGYHLTRQVVDEGATQDHKRKYMVHIDSKQKQNTIGGMGFFSTSKPVSEMYMNIVRCIA